MASIIPGYNYDIFISYRQKDNKGERWVSEFVGALKTELESAFKEEISVYFDVNPHDGLLETYDVDSSLKEKLKCLIFLPIMSRTYCDPGSFAWQSEFVRFIELASNDKYGLKIRLPDGNVASRVLPVKIHDLDKADIKQCESVLGGSLRGVEFIYREPGVNRPLLTKDNEEKNLNHTNYRNQINKIALAVREIIYSLKTGSVQPVPEKIHGKVPGGIYEKKAKGRNEGIPGSIRTKLLPAIIVTAIVATIIAYTQIFKKDTLEKLRMSGEKISIAVMPFQNMTNDTTWNIWQSGIQDILINSLSGSGELVVRQAEYINRLVESRGIANHASITPSVASTISQKLDSKVMINGNIKQAGNTLRLYAQLIDPGSEEVLKSFQIEGDSREENIFHLVDSLSTVVKNFLIITELEKDLPAYYMQLVTTNSPEAYRYFALGRNEYAKWDYPAAINWFTKALAIDSNFVQAITSISLAYGNQFEHLTMYSSAFESLYLIDLAKKWCLKAYEKTDQMTIQQKAATNWIHANYFGTPYDKIKYLKQLIEYDDQAVTAYFNLGNSYNSLFQYDRAIPQYEKALEIYENWGVKPFWVFDYAYLGDAYHKTGQFRKEAKLYRKAEQVFPGNPQLAGRLAILSLVNGDTAAADGYIKKITAAALDMFIPEAYLTALLADGYNEAGVLVRAEEYYRLAFSLDPANSDRINDLAYFLIDKELDINEGLELVDKKLDLMPGNFYLLHTKGFGLYKQGKYQEALQILQNSWDLRMQKAIYDHEAFLHLEAAKKAVTTMR